MQYFKKCKPNDQKIEYDLVEILLWHIRSWPEKKNEIQLWHTEHRVSINKECVYFFKIIIWFMQFWASLSSSWTRGNQRQNATHTETLHLSFNCQEDEKPARVHRKASQISSSLAATPIIVYYCVVSSGCILRYYPGITKFSPSGPIFKSTVVQIYFQWPRLLRGVVWSVQGTSL